MKYQIKAKASVLLSSPDFVADQRRGIREVIVFTMARSARNIQTLLDMDESLGRGSQGSKSQLNLALDCMADGAAALALIYGKLWQEAGNPTYNKTLQVSSPAWVAPRYDFTATLQVNLFERMPTN